MTESTRSLTPIISEEAFSPLVQIKSQSLFSMLSVFKDSNMTVNKPYYFTLLQEAEKLEGFLDDHGARTNLRWLYFAELVACVRNFSLAGFHLYHILDRYSDYLGGERDNLRHDFQEKTQQTLDYFSAVFLNFFDAMMEEVTAQGYEVKVTPMPKEEWDLNVTPQLPYTITGEEATNEEERIISIAQSFRKLVKDFRFHKLDQKMKVRTIEELIPGKINETMVTEMEILLHNLQSEYDTYIRGGLLEKSNEKIHNLRGLTAISMHLFEALKWLVHFYERHENNIRQSNVKTKISEMVNNERLMECITNYGLRFCGKYLKEGNKAAESILSFFSKPIVYELPIPQPQGFHARPSTYVSLVVQEHGTDVFMIVDGEKFNCRSVLDLLQAGGLLADSGKQTVTVEGDQRVLDDLKILAEHNYCEDRDIPQELSYIRVLRNL
ncbi:hypothetical protein MNBD_NITROSPINAE01-776 [hydrothermal vent metagenome]|uniref:HPr domain-containing protein n=1 Tax=hydrothermal vent metagenome TaxID=652676 RepID=A0A3B1C8C4_9ZZZZ